MKEGPWDIARGNITVFVGKDGALNKNGFRGHGRGSHLVLCNVLALGTAISTSTCLYFTIPLLREEHERCERISAVHACEGCRVFGGKTFEGVKLG